jgi:hypothetical protein
MRKPDDDIGLIDGEGYMVENAPYRTHLQVSNESNEVMIQIAIALMLNDLGSDPSAQIIRR